MKWLCRANNGVAWETNDKAPADPCPCKTKTCDLHGDFSKLLTVEAPETYCLHTEDAADHKCYEGCAASTFKNKGVRTPGACPASYGVVEKDQVVEQCEDGVTNLRYCPGNRVNVTLKVKGEALMEDARPLDYSSPTGTMGYVHQIETSPGDHCLEIAFPGGKSSAFWKSDGWKYGPPVRKEWVGGACDRTKWTSVDSKEENYDGWTSAKNAPDAAVAFTKYGYGKSLVQALAENCNKYDTIATCTADAACAWSHFGCVDKK
jgi:hypothetical protein